MFKELFYFSSPLVRILFVMWIALGTIYPAVTMAIHFTTMQQMWAAQPDLLIAGIIAVIVETSIITLLFITEFKLTHKTILLKHHEAELESIVAERTKSLQDALIDLEIVASTDHLTKIANRRQLKDSLKEEYRRAQRSARQFSIIMFDVDHFKKVNDTYGHAAGDKVLVAIAATVKAIVRDIDIFGRFGGEEFLIILSETSIVGAIELAERIRTIVKSLVIDGITCTISIGIANNTEATSTSHMIELADTALYAAKDAGRDTIRLAKPPSFINCSNCATCQDNRHCDHATSKFAAIDCSKLHFA